MSTMADDLGWDGEFKPLLSRKPATEETQKG